MRINAAVLLALVLGCSKEEPSTSSSSSSSSSARTTWSIRASKGGVAGDDTGAQVTLPPDAVHDDVDIEITPGEPEDADSAGRIWTLRVDGKERFTFAKPVKLSLPIDRSRAPAGSEVALCVHQDGSWEPVPGARVEGDRVVADVAHFSRYAPRKKGSGAGPSDDALKRFFKPETWHGSVHISVYGSGTRHSDGDQSSFSVSRDVQMAFRIVQQPGEAAGALALEKLQKSGFKIPPESEKGMTELLTRRHWTTKVTKPTTEDKTDLTFRISDSYDSSGQDYGEGGPTGDVYESHGRLNGDESGPVDAMHRLGIDISTRTYSLSCKYTLQSKLKCVESATGTPPKSTEYRGFVQYDFKNRPLPASGTTLKDRVKIPRKDVQHHIGEIPSGWSFNYGSLRGSITWTLSPGPPLVARISPPYAYKRGDLVTLDGSRSQGDIAKYRWTVRVADNFPDAPVWPREYTGPKVTFRALWDFTAELEVTSRTGGIDGTDQLFEIRPREGWRTTWTAPTEGDYTVAAMNYDGMQIGINQCAKEPEGTETGHKIHRDAAGGTSWIDQYELGTVEDDGGPFAGMSYLLKQTLEIARIERVNVKIKPGGSVYVMNTDRGNKKDIDKLFDQVKAHEKAHSTLLKEAFDRLVKGGKDPAEQIESVVGATSASAQDRADTKIRDAETALAAATSEANVKAKLRRRPYLDKVSIWLPPARGGDPDDIKLKPLGQLSEIGDE